MSPYHFAVIGMLVILPIIILVDSKRRFGEFSWGWAVFSFFGVFAAQALIVALIGPLIQDLELLYKSAITIGVLIGIYVGGFALYRVKTRQKFKEITNNHGNTNVDTRAEALSTESIVKTSLDKGANESKSESGIARFGLTHYLQALRKPIKIGIIFALVLILFTTVSNIYLVENPEKPANLIVGLAVITYIVISLSIFYTSVKYACQLYKESAGVIELSKSIFAGILICILLSVIPILITGYIKYYTTQ